MYDYAYPYMSNNAINGTVYIISDIIGTQNNMTAAELQELYASGWTVGNHTKTHAHLDTLSEADQETQLNACRDVLVGLGIDTGTHVAYPYGGSNADTLTAMAAQSMLTGRTVNAGAFALADVSNNYLINCNDVSGSTLAAVKTLIDNAMAANKMIVLLFHQFALSNPAAGVWLVSDFQALIDYIVAQGYNTGTMAELYGLL